MTEPVDPRPDQPTSGPTDPWRPPPPHPADEHQPADEHPTEQLGWPPASSGAWAPPPVDGQRPEPHTVFLDDGSQPADPVRARRSAKSALSATGLLLAGLLVGAVAVWAVQSQSSDAAQTGATSGLGNQLPLGQGNGNGHSGQSGQVPNGQLPNGTGNGPSGQVPNGGGGLAGERRLVGTITAVGRSTVSVKAMGGGSSQTYTVGSDTEIVRNGSRAKLSDLKVGDLAFLHVYPQGSTTMVERIFAGALPGGGQGLPGFGGGPGGGSDDQNGSGTGSSTTT